MKKIIIRNNQTNERVDKFLAKEFFSYSRGEIIKKIKNGEVKINGKNEKPGYILRENDVIEIENFPREKNNEPVADDKIPLQILFENENIIIINKQAGIQVHPSHNEKKNTLVNGLIAKYPEIKNVHDESHDGKFRPGIVHRLDKDTSGVMVIARNKKTFDELKKQFKNRLIEKRYVAVCEGIFEKKEGLIEKSLARSSDYRRQVIARENTKTKTRKAATHYKVIKEHGHYSLVEVFPKTGRMHQIRVHLAFVGHPVVGDLVYAGKRKIEKDTEKKAKRQLLHAEELKFELFGKKYSFLAPIPQDLKSFLANID